MKLLYLAVAALFASTGCKNKSESKTENTTTTTMSIKYPDTRKDTTVFDEYFGSRIADPYRWLENDTSAETGAWVKAQNAVTQEYLSSIPFRSAIRKRYEELFNYEKFSAPSKEGNYYYYFKNTGLQNHAVMYRELITGSATPEVFLDPNGFSADGTTSLAGVSFSRDGSLAVYNLSEGGSDWQKMIVIDAATKKQVGDTLLDIKFSGASWNNNDGFFYSTYPRPKEGSFLAGVTEKHQLFYHKLGTPQSADKAIYGQTGPAVRYVSGGVTEDQNWLVISAANSTYGNALSVLDLRKPGAQVVPLVRDFTNSHGVIDNDSSNFYIQTDRNAPNGRIVSVSSASPAENNWTTIIETRPEVLSASSAGGFLFCTYLKDAVSAVHQYDYAGKKLREIALPGLGSTSGFYGKKADKDIFFTFTSYTSPISIYRLNVETGSNQLYKKPTVQFKPELYESKQVFYTSKDGTKVPMIITYKKGLELKGKNPCLLYGYGGFSVNLTPAFSTSNIILLENGGIYAVPNLRGGGEYGEAWHQQGIKLKKQNVFDDFMAAAKFLTDSGYTSRDLLAIEGGSNGGLLVGACITQQPEMCKVAFPAVGVMDMLRYHKFTAGAGWAYDYGTAEESREMFDYLYKYSPVHNIKDAAYPATMITTADHDDRVVPAHSFKFAAALQARQTGSDPVLIRIETKAGHGAGKSTKQILDEQSDKWSFMFHNLGVKPAY